MARYVTGAPGDLNPACINSCCSFLASAAEGGSRRLTGEANRWANSELPPRSSRLTTVLTGPALFSPKRFSRSVAALCGRFKSQYAPSIASEIQTKVEMAMIISILVSSQLSVVSGPSITGVLLGWGFMASVGLSRQVGSVGFLQRTTSH